MFYDDSSSGSHADFGPSDFSRNFSDFGWLRQHVFARPTPCIDRSLVPGSNRDRSDSVYDALLEAQSLLVIQS